ncbi:hypothetical protein BLNAU_5167 [Blattamonas nauphoetae]|uniref:Uncharacterized protein n=1 Tax=Blattamonas nauphoetae TaxID=2049346 RepID=A0ABQ9Y8A7_9EUKA|nr:hypothetical protein BLNAU_5167 [Blattamonas nauphoetae]
MMMTMTRISLKRIKQFLLLPELQQEEEVHMPEDLLHCKSRMETSTGLTSAGDRKGLTYLLCSPFLVWRRLRDSIQIERSGVRSALLPTTLLVLRRMPEPVVDAWFQVIGTSSVERRVVAVFTPALPMRGTAVLGVFFVVTSSKLDVGTCFFRKDDRAASLVGVERNQRSLRSGGVSELTQNGTRKDKKASTHFVWLWRERQEGNSVRPNSLSVRRRPLRPQ